MITSGAIPKSQQKGSRFNRKVREGKGKKPPKKK